MLSPSDIEVLRCPLCGGPLTFQGGTRHGFVRTGAMPCGRCPSSWVCRGGVPDLHKEEEIQGPDRWMRVGYDRFALQHDIGLRYFLPRMQDGVTEDAMRERFLSHLRLGHLRPRDDGRPLRVLEVGVGTGSNLPLFVRLIPKGLAVELWGCDLSRGMLDRASRRVERWKLLGPDGRPPRLLIADAHALPFASGSFDRVLHVGGIGAFASPTRAMREMVRVARPSSEVVVVDEALDPSRRHSLLHKLCFWSLTALDPDPRPPREGIPFGSTMIADEQLSRFYYCLAFQTPPAPAPRA